MLVSPASLTKPSLVVRNRIEKERYGDEGEEGQPRPGGAFGNEVVAGEDELGDAEDALLLEGGDGAGPRDPLHRPLESLVQPLRQHHPLSLPSFPPSFPSRGEQRTEETERRHQKQQRRDQRPIQLGFQGSISMDPVYRVLLSWTRETERER